MVELHPDACERCGHEIKIGEFPFCKGDSSAHGRWMTAEEPLTPYVDEMIAPEGKEFRTRGERMRYMDRNHIVPANNRDKGTMKGRGTLFFDQGRR